MSGGGMAVGGGIGGIIIAVLYMLLGGDPSQAPELLPGQTSSTGKQYDARQSAGDDTLAQFTSH
jgi:predicted metalloprotease